MSALALVALALMVLWALQGPQSPESPNSNELEDATSTGNGPLATNGALSTDDLDRLAVDDMANFIPSRPRKPVSAKVFENEDGAKITIADFRGRVVLLNFWATWCAPCRRELPSLDRLERDLGGADFTVVAISVDRAGREKAQAFMDEVGVENLALYLDKANRLGRSLGATGLPTTVLVDAKGYVVGRLIGPAEWDSDAAVALIEAVIAEGD